MMKRQFVWPLNVNDLEYESLEQELTCIEKTLQTEPSQLVINALNHNFTPKHKTIASDRWMYQCINKRSPKRKSFGYRFGMPLACR